MQVLDGETGYLVDGPLACAERTYSLLRQPDVRTAMGQRGREHVRQHFLDHASSERLPGVVRQPLTVGV